MGAILSLIHWIQYKSDTLHTSKRFFVYIGQMPEDLKSLISSFKSITEIHQFKSYEEFLNWPAYFNDKSNSENFFYPEINQQVSEITYDYDILYKTEELNREFLELNDSVMNEAENFLNRFQNKYIVSVHLKNQGNLPNTSNSNQIEWLKFFSKSEKIYPNIRFCVVGHDDLEEYIRESQNVVIVKDSINSFAVHLGVMALSSAFLGMSTGPCNYVIFSKKPYLIFKNYNHHRDLIQKSLDKKRLFFSSNAQIFLNVDESEEELSKNFGSIVKYIKAKS